jgi:hypothetical protein
MMGWRKRAVYVAMSLVLLLAAIPLIFSVNMLERELLLGDPALEIPSTHRLLANEQSNGFFDDIMDGSWTLMQQRARSFVQIDFPLDGNNLQVSTSRCHVDSNDSERTKPSFSSLSRLLSNLD